MTNTLLVIDDSPTVRKLVEISFSRTPWKLSFAASGKEGVALSEQLRPEVVLLDYVLPDMNGTDVCVEMMRRGLDQLRIVLMTAKEERIRTQFAGFPMVVDYVTKPFTASAVVDKAESALRRGSSSRSVSTSFVSPGLDQKHAVGQALYAVLRHRLDEAPAWVREAPAVGAGPFLARRLLNPETVDAVTRELGTLGTFGAAGEARPAETNAVGSASLPVSGVVDPIDVLDVLAQKRKTGVLAIEALGTTWRCVLREGALTLVTNRDPRVDLRLVDGDGSVAREISPSAEADHVSLRKPVLVAEAGGAEQRDREARSFASVATAAFVGIFTKPLTMAWRDGVEMDPITLARLPRLSVPQLRLEVLRAIPETTSRLAPGDAVARPRGFSSRVSAFQLTADERAVLTVASDPVTFEDIAGRTGLPRPLVERTVRRLVAVALLERSPDRAARKQTTRIAIAEPDADTRAALAEILGAHYPDAEIQLHQTLSDLERSLRLAPPQLVVANVSRNLTEASRFAGAVRNELVIESPLLAVLDEADPDLESRLPVSGFDGVLTKPILVDDVIAHLEGP